VNKSLGKFAFVFLFVMLIALTGCGKDNKNATSGAGANTSQPNPTSAQPTDAKHKDQPLQELTVATVGDTAVFAPIYYAQEKDIWAKYGLKVKRVSLDAGASLAALISGDAQIVLAGPNIVDSALKTDKVKVIGTYGQIALSLYAKNIRKLEELKGKTIGATSPGGAIDYVARTLVRAIGMQEGKDVKILYTGSNQASLAVISTGKIEAGVISPPTTIQAEQMGLINVANLNEVKGVLGLYGVMGVHQPFAEKNPQAIENFMKAYSEASKLMRTDKIATKAAIQKYTKSTDDKVLDVSYEAYKNLWPTDLHIPDSEIQFILEELSEKNPVAKTKKPADVTDNRFADAVK
jgi:ABC-type nitrate/sulfonate/bicarbonate transport system substrate-binding protein